MMRSCLLLALVASVLHAAAPFQPGKDPKIRILVDKVMQPVEKWVTKEWMVKEAAEAGFNVFSPRKGFDRPDEVRDVTEWCRKYGIFHMPWMRGSLAAPEDDTAKGKRLVWANGTEQPLWSVNSDEFWAWTRKYIILYAKLSAENPSLCGVFLDYENYAKRKCGNLYSLSYDDQILAAFARKQGVEIPDLAFDERARWLHDQGLHNAFEAFQVNHWRERCRALRKAVDALNPDFQFCIYPAPGTPFMVRACYPEWTSKEAPIILADPWVYGRPSAFLPQLAALQANQRKLEAGMKIPQEAKIPFVYAGGIDPVVTGADPEFSGKNAVMISECTDGYWIFYEGPKYETTHKDYWKWFTWANEAIAKKRWSVWQEPRETPENALLTVFDQATGAGRFLPPDMPTEVEFPKVIMRGSNFLAAYVQAGQEMQIGLRHQPVGKYTDVLSWRVQTPENKLLAEGIVPHGKRGTVVLTPKQTGVYLVALSAGACAYTVESTNVPLNLVSTREGMSFIYGVERLYFDVSKGAKSFTVTVRTAGVETARVALFGPDGAPKGTVETEPGKSRLSLKVNVAADSAGVWSMGIGEASEGVLEDVRVYLKGDVSPFVSLVPELVFRERAPAKQ
jgi:hypothetical protein